MKILKYIIMLLTVASVTFSTTIESDITRQKKNTIAFIQEILSKQPYEALIADVFSADIFVEELPKVKKKVADELILVLPDVRGLKENIESLSTKDMDIMIFLWDKPVTEDKYLKNRSYEEYGKLGIKKYKNVKIFKIPTKKEYVYSVVADSINKRIIDTELFNKEVKGKYIKNSRYKYYQALN